MVGRKLGHYAVVERIGAGGMGEVYRAHDEQLDRDVALKVLPASHFSDDTARARLLREARAAAALNHPNICTIHEVGEADGQAYIAMELIEGRPLAELIPRGGLPVEQVLRYGSQIAGALAHAHERGIVHRDLKCGNVVITADGRAKVLDFGLAKRLSHEELVEATTQSQESLTQPGAVLGTLPYMAPEQLRGQGADARSDVWALGVVLHEIAAGARPFQGQTGYELSSAILNQPPRPPPTKVPVELRAVIERCLAKEPGQRYQRAGEVRAALETLATGAAVPGLKWKYLARRRWFRATTALAAVVLVLAVLLGLNVAGLRDRLFGPATPKIDSIAVLPFENLSGDPAQDYLVDGIHEALITDLARLSGLKRVIARTSVNRYKGTKKPVREIAQELNVDAVVTGSVLRAGERVRVTAQLINPQTEEHLWADRYERDLRDVISVQNEIVSSIARQVELKLTPQEQVHLARARPVNPAAYDAYLLAEYFNRRGPGDNEKAISYYQKAIQIDPGYAQAWAGLANAQSLQAETEEEFRKARSTAEQALALDPNLADAHGALGGIKRNYDWDWAGADASFQRALALEPGNPWTVAGVGAMARTFGRCEEAFALFRRAVELDPFAPGLRMPLGMNAYCAGRLEEAVAAYQKGLELNPELPIAHHFLGKIYLAQGRPQEALLEMEREPYPLFRVYGLVLVYHAMGRKRESDAALAEMIEKYQNGAAYQIAAAYAFRGEADRAFEWLERAYAQRDGGLVHVKADPLLKSLRGDPRYAAFLAKMRLPV